MAVRTKRLFLGASGAAGTLNLVYTCPAGETAIIKSIGLVRPAAAAAGCLFAIRTGGVDTFVLRVDTNAGGGALSLPWIVMHPGDELRVLAAIANEFMMAISGTELEGVAD